MNYKLDGIESGGSTGLDSFFQANPRIVSPVGTTKTAAVKPGRIKVGSIKQLQGFQRISSDTLINKATQDLWAIKKEGESFFIERLFQENNAPESNS